MKQFWIKESKRVVDQNIMTGTDHENWLDTLGLYETGWFIFAHGYSNRLSSYGYPTNESI